MSILPIVYLVIIALKCPSRNVTVLQEAKRMKGRKLMRGGYCLDDSCP